MKKVLLVISLLTAMSFGYCEYGSLKNCSLVGGHYEGIYYFSGHGNMIFTFHGWCPASLRYDFWAGNVCTY